MTVVKILQEIKSGYYYAHFIGSNQKPRGLYIHQLMTVTEMRLEHSLICLLLFFIQEIIVIKLDDILNAVQGIGRKGYKKMSYVNHSRAEMQSVDQNMQSVDQNNTK